MSGKVALNYVGDREPNYLLSGTLANGSGVVLAKWVNTGDDIFQQEYQFIGEPIWPSGKVGLKNAPLDTPLCGFKNERCKNKVWNATWVIFVAVFSACIAVALAAGLGTLFCRKIRFEADLTRQTWRVKRDELEIGDEMGMATDTITTPNNSTSSVVETEGSDTQRKATMAQQKAAFSASYAKHEHANVDLAYYRGTIVTVKHLHRQHIQITRQIKLEFKQVSRTCAFSHC
ncbi:hypothetical protein LSAT2_014719 [Lamellibrachia satsuma]|nr:hypothetical protein LSAT2_014719 [Lamellibrachia satsuma]